jgi:exodeoxyribonuclease V alpha subunit
MVTSEHNQFQNELQESISRLALTDLDIAFGHFIYQHEPQHKGQLALLGAWVSNRLNQQDTCVDIYQIEAQRLTLMGFNGVEDLQKKIQQAVCFSTQMDKISTPIMVDLNRLYLRRYFQYELKLAALIKAKMSLTRDLDLSLHRQVLETLFDLPDQTKGASSKTVIDWQCVAACIATLRDFSLITGGPGTGKTTTVAKLLALLNGVATQQARQLHIKLVAPTGKAAARLTESIEQAKDRLSSPYLADLDMQCSTIHRLLGSIPHRIDFKHNEFNPLHLDVLVVDEASMVDLALMYRLFSALPKHAKIVLLGDHNQLSSVETGSVLSDICEAARPESSLLAYATETANLVQEMSGHALPSAVAHGQNLLTECFVKLVKSHRFSEHSSIGKLANEIITGQVTAALQLLENPHHPDVGWRQDKTPHTLVDEYVNGSLSYFDAIRDNNLHDAFAILTQRQILCAFKSGSWGTQAINHAIERVLFKRGVIDLDKPAYAGRPIMLAKNDHSLGLFNGDVGIILPDPTQPTLTKAWFLSPEQTLKGVLVSRLPEYDTVYAMTIHKSQGSEFNHIDLCLPEETSVQSGKLLSRELLYTGLTRAKQSFHLYSPSSLLHRCLQSECKRGSGLHLRL